MPTIYCGGSGQVWPSSNGGLNLYDLSGYPVHSTEEALRSDWERLGLDFKKAIEHVNEQSASGAPLEAKAEK
jgi:hypothetical protein